MAITSAKMTTTQDKFEPKPLCVLSSEKKKEKLGTDDPEPLICLITFFEKK